MKIIVTEEQFTPVRSTDGSAGYDVRANWEGVIAPGERQLIPLGFRMSIEDPFAVALLFPHPGLMSRPGLVPGNLVGLLDPGYQGEVAASVWNTGDRPFPVERGELLAQLSFASVVTPDFELEDTSLEIDTLE